MERTLDRVSKLLSNKWSYLFGNITVITFFLFVILIPTMYVFSYVFLDWKGVYTLVFSDPIAGDFRWRFMKQALVLSFEISTIVTLIDVAIGLPMALILARYDFRGKKAVDTLIDLPLAVPTSTLGFSIFLFWGTRGGISSLLGMETGLFSRGPIMIILAHVAFSYPYIVRSLTAVIEETDVAYEYAARTLGASSFTAFRTITLSLIKPGLITGIILAFTRSLGETGATLIVSGITETAPVMVVSWRQMLLIPPAAFLSMILVTIACGLLALVNLLARRWRFPIKKVWPRVEKNLSGVFARRAKNTFSFLIFLLIILIPSCFTFFYVASWWAGSPYTGNPEAGVYYQIFMAPDRKWRSLLTSILTSLEVATIVTCIDLAFGIPMALFIIRGKWKTMRAILDTLLNVPLSIPSAALGFSTYLFWGSKGLGVFSPGFWLIVLVHVVFTYPYMVRQVMAVLEGLPPMYEEAAHTLGAKPFTVFRTITLPLIMPGIIAGIIMCFTRSLGETGATIVVMGLSRTVPVLIVNWVESMALPAVAFASIILIGICYALMLVFRYLTEMTGMRVRV